MGNDQDAATAGLPAGGGGRLAQVIATRGGLAAPESPFVIEHREALIYMLCEAAELEHGIMCQYLFAAFSLKQSEHEGVSGAELDAATARWRKQVSHVAAQEMLHLALVHNLLSAIGAAPHMARPNLPAPASHYPAGVQLALLPFGEQALRHFMFLERPEGMDLADAEGLAAVGRAAPMLNERDIVPRGQDFATVGHLYRSIEAGFAHLAEMHGEDWLFVGPLRAQATAEHFGWPELVAVTDLASAQRAIEEILEQGEGPRGHWRDAHFGQFVSILDEYQQLREANPDFDPVRPVMAANVRPPERDVDVPLIGDPLTARVTDLFNVGYEILLQIFERFFAHTEETDAELKALADATVAIMLRVIKPLGDLITTLPVGEEHPGMTAGPSFELFYESDYLMPHREAAWALLAERLDEAAWLCDQLQSGRGQSIVGQLDPVLAAMRETSRSLAAHLPAGSAHARLADPAPRLEQAELGTLLERAAELEGAVTGRGGTADPGRELHELFGAAYAIVTQAAAGLGCDVGEQALIVPRLVGSVLRPLAHALGRTPDRPEDTTAPGGAGEVGSPGRSGRTAGAGTPGLIGTPPAGTAPAGTAPAGTAPAGVTPAGVTPAGTRRRPGVGGGQDGDRAAGAPGPGLLQPAGTRRGHRRAAGPGRPARGARRGRGAPGRAVGAAVRAARLGPGRTERAVPGDERAAADQPPGSRNPARAAAGPLPLRQVLDQAAVRRQSRQHRVHRRQGPQAGSRPARHLRRPAADHLRQPRYLPALGAVHRPARHGVPHRRRAVRGRQRRPDG